MSTDYEQIADRYDEDRARWVVPVDDIVVALRSARVLDVGCGTGTWLRAQAAVATHAGVTLYGADPSAGMLAVAQRKGLANLVRAGAERLPFPDASFDYLVGNFTFHHWDKERALDEMARVLASDGAFRLNNIEPAAGWWLYDFFPEAVAIDAARFWPADRIVDALRARGFVVDVVSETFAEDVSVPEALTEAERRVISQLAVIDDVAYAAGLARLRAAATDVTTLRTTRATVCVTARRF